MTALQVEQPAYDRAVCDAMVASAPDGWNIIVLYLERAEGITAVGRLQHSITSPGDMRSATPEDSLYDATYRLDELFQRHGALFHRAVYRVELLPDSWRYTADFGYDPRGVSE